MIRLDHNSTDSKGRPMSDQFIHWWNDTTPESVELKKLKEEKDDELKNMIEELKEQLTPVVKFFNQPVERPKQRVSKKEQAKIDLQEHRRKLDLAALAEIKKGH